MTLLQTQGLTRRYAGLIAVDDVSIGVREGAIHAVIGPNGAGKTTLFNLISGVVPPSGGRIVFAGTDVTRQPADSRAAMGMTRTFQNIRVFGGLTVLENVLTGMHTRLGRTVWPGFFAAERRAAASARETLALVGLAARADEPAAALPYGDQRRLEIARALASKPRLLLLDEPAAGMNPAETEALATLVRRIRDSGTTVLLVEHDMGFVMDLCDRITVLNFGRMIFEGPPAEVRRAPAVIEAYLGPKVAARLATRP
jgi:branched-chain amino acid transport system ATP-binding protein